MFTVYHAQLNLRHLRIGHSVYIPPSIPQIIVDCFEQLVQKAYEINNPFEQAFFIMVHLPYLQPFEDVNKCTYRLAANISLIKNNLCPLSFIDVHEEVYVHGQINPRKTGIKAFLHMKIEEYIQDLSAQGIRTITSKEVKAALGKSDKAAWNAIERQKAKGRLASPAKGFYIIIPPGLSDQPCLG